METPSTEKQKVILMFNASAAKECSCKLRTFLTIYKGYTSAINPNDIEYGQAFHIFAKVLEESGGNVGLAMQAGAKHFDETPMKVKPKKQWLNKTHLLTACTTYYNEVMSMDDFEVLKSPVDGTPLVEQKLAYPFYQDELVEVVLCGTIDRIGKKRNGAYMIDDFKTTSVWDIEGYFAGYKLSPQLMFYRLMIRYYAKMYPDSIWAEMEQKDVGCRITGIFLKAPSKEDAGKGGTSFKHSDVFFFKQQQLNEFEALLYREVRSIVEQVKDYIISGSNEPFREGMFNGSCETKYGHCKFFDACSAPNPIAREQVLKHNFVQKPYNPLDYNA